MSNIPAEMRLALGGDEKSLREQQGFCSYSPNRDLINNNSSHLKAEE
jgi:hypothetical protein